jgi:hypothetical protein
VNRVVVGIHQPNYLPWLGYFSKMLRCDHFVLLDNVQYSKGSFTNRNTIKGTCRHPLLLTVPLINRRGGFKNIDEIKIDNTKPWARKHLSSIFHSYKKAPFFDTYFPIIEKELVNAADSLSLLNTAILIKLAQIISCKTTITQSSSLNLLSTDKNERIIEICEKLNSTIYLCGKGGLNYQEKEKFDTAGITIQDLNFQHPAYPQFTNKFTPNLSLIDALFFCGPKEISRFLR